MSKNILTSYYYSQIKTKKKLGQNFLINTCVAKKILQYISLNKNSLVLEIGTGLGILTSVLIETNLAKIYSVEIDMSLKNYLAHFALEPKLYILFQDILKLQEEKLFKKKFKIIANLPYNISTQLIIKWLKKFPFIEEIVIIVQTEVAKRIIAKNNTKNFGRLSVILQYLCKCDLLFHIFPNNFYPSPNVNSSVIRLVPQKKIFNIKNILKLEYTCQKLFNQKRKTLYNIIKDKSNNISYILNKLNINKNLRAENLTINEIYQISCII